MHGQTLAEERAPMVGRIPIVVIPHGTSSRFEPLLCPESPTALLFDRLEQYKGGRCSPRRWPGVGTTSCGEAGRGPEQATRHGLSRMIGGSRSFPGTSLRGRSTLFGEASLSSAGGTNTDPEDAGNGQILACHIVELPGKTVTLCFHSRYSPPPGG